MMKNFMNKPITWGSIIKTCGAAMAVYTIIAGVCFVKINGNKKTADMKETEDEI